MLDAAQDKVAEEYELKVNTPTKKRVSKRAQAEEERRVARRQQVDPNYTVPPNHVLPYQPNVKLATGKKIEQVWYPAAQWTHADVVAALAAGAVPRAAIEAATGRPPRIGLEPLRAHRWTPLNHIEENYGDEIRCRSLFRTVVRQPALGDYQWSGNPPPAGPAPPLPDIRHMAGWMRDAGRLTYQALRDHGYTHEQIAPIAPAYNIRLPRRH